MALIGGVIQDGYESTIEGKDSSGNVTYTNGRPFIHSVQEVGNFSAYYTNDKLKLLIGKQDADGNDYNVDENGGVYLTGFKLESVILSTAQQIDNAHIVPLVNGDSITLTNRSKAGTISFNASRTSGGIGGGDCVSVFDFVKTQGNPAGRLVLKWNMNGHEHTLRLVQVCVKQCPPVVLAGNDVPDYQVQLTYADYSDSSSPAYNENL